MYNNIKQLPLDGKVIVIIKFADDFVHCVNLGTVRNKLIYTISSRVEDRSITRSARFAALKTFSDMVDDAIVKRAFDTRNIDQEHIRNPRANLQYWHRSQPFIDNDSQDKIDALLKLRDPLESIKNEYGSRPDWHESYARVLYDAIDRILRIKIADNDIDCSQLSYLEQLLYTRYRLNKDDLIKLSGNELKDIILQKDESLLKKGIIYKNNDAELKYENNKRNSDLENRFMELIARADLSKLDVAKKQPIQLVDNKKENALSVDNKKENALSAIFGNLRHSGERAVERTITITIREDVKD